MLYALGPVGLSTARTTFLSFSFWANSLSLPFILSLLVSRMTTALNFWSAWVAVADSSCLTRLVKPGVTSRANMRPIGLLPLAQTGHCFWPAVGPVTINGWNMGTASPGLSPDLRSALGPGMASTLTVARGKRYRIIG